MFNRSLCSWRYIALDALGIDNRTSRSIALSQMLKLQCLKVARSTSFIVMTRQLDNKSCFTNGTPFDIMITTLQYKDTFGLSNLHRAIPHCSRTDNMTEKTLNLHCSSRTPAFAGDWQAHFLRMDRTQELFYGHAREDAKIAVLSSGQP
jgi:hypothetical protein